LCTLCVSSLSSTCSLFCYLTTRRPPTSPLFPYTTLFRSVSQARHQHAGRPARRAHRARARDRVRRTARRRGVRRLLSRRGPPVAGASPPRGGGPRPDDLGREPEPGSVRASVASTTAAPGRRAPRTTGGRMIEVAALTKRYGPTTAVDGLTFTARAGAV